MNLNNLHVLHNCQSICLLLGTVFCLVNVVYGDEYTCRKGSSGNEFIVVFANGCTLSIKNVIDTSLAFKTSDTSLAF